MRIAVFCDGTWNSSKDKNTTNIYDLYRMVEDNHAIGQVSVYFSGVGTDARFKNGSWIDGIKRFLNKYAGGALGAGLEDKVKQAYQFICSVYQPGDEIYLFGFSRGAYTARSLAGMIRKCGIVDDYTPENIDQAFDLYRKTGVRNEPDDPDIMTARKRISPRFATSQTEIDTRNDGSELVKIAYLGVLDTVGARGMPPSVFGPLAVLWNSRYKFHDMKLSRLVQSARHALALQERRIFFVPALWDNLDESAQGEGLNQNDTGPFRPYQQVWFTGDHAIIGGSADGDEPLSAIVLDWLIQGAGRLALNNGAQNALVKADALHKTARLQIGWSLFRKWRKGPVLKRDVHDSVYQRINATADYRPESLNQLHGRHQIFPDGS